MRVIYANTGTSGVPTLLYEFLFLSHQPLSAYGSSGRGGASSTLLACMTNADKL